VFLVFNGGFNVMYYMWDTLALTFTSPIVVSMCTMVEIPMAAVVDYFLYKERYSAPKIFGMCLIICAAIGLNFIEIGDKISSTKRRRGNRGDSSTSYPVTRSRNTQEEQLGLDNI